MPVIAAIAATTDAMMNNLRMASSYKPTPGPPRGLVAAAEIRIRLPCPLARRMVMSMVVRFYPTNMTAEQYDDEARREEGTGKFPPEGRDYHIFSGTDGDLRVSEIWDSQGLF